VLGQIPVVLPHCHWQQTTVMLCNFKMGEKMDKTLLKEIIKDFEGVLKIINSRLSQLYSMLGETPSKFEHITARNEIKENIEKQRSDMMLKIDNMRKQAMTQVQESVGNIPLSYTSPVAGRVPTDLCEFENMKKQILEKIEEKNNLYKEGKIK
jgi:hypothetical protein